MLHSTKFFYENDIQTLRSKFHQTLHSIQRNQQPCTDIYKQQFSNDQQLLSEQHYDDDSSTTSMNVPADIMISIMSYLTISETMNKCSVLNKYWNSVCRSDQLWNHYLKLNYMKSHRIQQCGIVCNARNVFMQEYLYMKWGYTADRMERVLREHSELIQIYKNTGGYGRPVKPGLISIQDTSNGEIVDVYFVSWRHLYGWLGVLLPLFCAISVSLKADSLISPLSRENSLIMMVMTAALLGTFVRWRTYEVYFDESGKNERKDYERLPITFLVLLWGMLITCVTLGRPV
jgi:hypothetical protein